ncbi:MAG: helix-turn-helix domain-containing protein [Rubellimicrobium sp.]|nr:helix-turn-helix domain-containing protein [Rubellimicrobium sp.]
MTMPPHITRLRISLYHLPDAATRHALMTVLRAGWQDATPGGSVSRTSCPGDDILYCMSGQGEVQIADQSFRLAPGQIAWIAGDVPHGHTADRQDPWSLMWFRMQAPDLPLLRRRLFGQGRPRVTLADGTRALAWFQDLFGILDTPTTDADLRLHAALARFLELLIGPGNPGTRSVLPASLDRLVNGLIERPQDPWTSADMVRIASVSPSQLRRLFQNHLGTTPRAFLRNQRLVRAQRLMQDRSLTLQQVADHCGFCDVYHFSRDFKRVVGQSPSSWRRAEWNG